MCELFAMSARQPTTVNLSLGVLSLRGGVTGHHRDGWGIGYYIGGDALRIRESGPAADSPTVRFVRDHDYQSGIVLAHIRKATQGARSLANTQPFRRELGGAIHLFAHNGHLHDYQQLPLGHARPIGTTDSEHAFCALLALLEPIWADGRPSVAQTLAVVRSFAERIRPLGPANFLYADGEVVFVHGHRRTQADGEIRAPGLWHLCRTCTEDCGKLVESGVSLSPSQQVHLVASVPLTDEAWIPMDEGELLVLRQGCVQATPGS